MGSVFWDKVSKKTGAEYKILEISTCRPSHRHLTLIRPASFQALIKGALKRWIFRSLRCVTIQRRSCLSASVVLKSSQSCLISKALQKSTLWCHVCLLLLENAHDVTLLLRLTLGISMKLGLAVEMSPRVFKEQFTSWERMSHAASADSLLLSTWQHTEKMALWVGQHIKIHFASSLNCCNLKLPPSLSYLEADILQVVRMPLDDLFDEVWVCGLQVGAGWLVQLKLKASPQFWHVKGLVPAPAHLQQQHKLFNFSCWRQKYFFFFILRQEDKMWLREEKPIINLRGVTLAQMSRIWLVETGKQQHYTSACLLFKLLLSYIIIMLRSYLEK